MDKHSPAGLMESVCETLLQVALVSLVVLTVPCVAAILDWRPVDVNADLIVPLAIRQPDILFVIGQLLLILNLWLYFRCLLPFVGEGPWDKLLSVVLAMVIVLTNYFAMLKPALPYRGAFVALILLVTFFKDISLRRRFPDSGLVRAWYLNVLFTFCGAVFIALTFFGLMDEHFRTGTLGLSGPPPVFDVVIPGLFYLAHAVVAGRSFRKNYIFFQQRQGAELVKFVETAPAV